MDNITLYKQIHPCHCRSLANLGYKTLINLRLDDECDHQPSSQTLQAAATLAKLHYQHLPICGDDVLSLATVKQFAQLINQSQKPIMVFCGTGGRAKRLYQSAEILGLLTHQSAVG